MGQLFIGFRGQFSCKYNPFLGIFRTYWDVIGKHVSGLGEYFWIAFIEHIDSDRLHIFGR